MCGENGEWNPAFYAQYIRTHPERFFYEGLREKINIKSSEPLINTYYGSMPMRCVPILDFLNNRYIEHTSHSIETDTFIDKLNQLYKFHENRTAYVYNTLMYYNSQFVKDSINRTKKKRLLFILACKQDYEILKI